MVASVDTLQPVSDHLLILPKTNAFAAPASAYDQIYGLVLLPLGNSLELITFRDSRNTE